MERERAAERAAACALAPCAPTANQRTRLTSHGVARDGHEEQDGRPHRALGLCVSEGGCALCARVCPG